MSFPYIDVSLYALQSYISATFCRIEGWPTPLLRTAGGPAFRAFCEGWGSSSHHRQSRLADLNLGTPEARNTFVHSLERARLWYGFYLVGYVVMPEHVHLLISEPERSSLNVALQMLKQIVSRKLRRKTADRPFWQPRYYDFNVWSERKRVEKLRYIHNNSVKRGLVVNPGQWAWSSSRHYASGEESVVEIESWWTAKRREALGIHPTIRRVS